MRQSRLTKILNEHKIKNSRSLRETFDADDEYFYFDNIESYGDELYELVHEGFLDAETVVDNLIQYLSDDQICDFMVWWGLDDDLNNMYYDEYNEA